MFLLQRFLFASLLLFGLGAPALAAYDDERAITPPRLSYLDGEISFWRPGAEDWFEARLNTPIAVGDELYAGDGANFELQIDSRAFIRADEQTQLALVNHEPDYIQFRMTTGRLSLDLRRLDPGMTIEVATPDAVFSIAQEGYYRLDIGTDTRFITRRGGRATVIPAGGRAMSILPSEEVVVRGGDPVRVETYVAPETDRWDNWNYTRSDDLLDAVSTRYLPQGVYGADELDRYGNWRVVPDYGSIWIPDRVPSGWAPYSTGSWVWDPYYEWSWIDDAPWGWAPFHYGRWVFVNGYWAWAPGPTALRRARYSPALVAFFWDGGDVSLRIGLGVPGVFWVSLGWGEPIIPWWGRSGFRGQPWWGGWHGPRIVNNVVIRETTVVNVTNIVYRNARHARAVAYAPREQFGRAYERVRQADRVMDIERLTRLQGALPVKPGPHSVAVGTRKVVQPARTTAARSVVATRTPRETSLPWRDPRPQASQTPRPQVRVVPAPKIEETNVRRPDYGTQGQVERPRPQQSPRYREMPQPRTIAPAPARAVDPGVSRGVPGQPVGVERGARPIQQAPVGREPQPIRDTPAVRAAPVPRTTPAPSAAPTIRATPAPSAAPAIRAAPTPRPAPMTRDTREIVRERGAPGQSVSGREPAGGAPASLPGKPANRMYQQNERDERDESGRGGARPAR